MILKIIQIDLSKQAISYRTIPQDQAPVLGSGPLGFRFLSGLSMTQAVLPAPTSRRTFLVWIVLLVIGVAWGLTGPLSKLAVSTGNHPIGITFWNTVIGVIVLTTLLLATGKRLPLSRHHVFFFLVCGLLGTALPSSVSYKAYEYLPVGVNLIIISLVPMATILLALPLGLEKLDPGRFAGLLLGIIAVIMIAAPDTSLPDPGMAKWVILPVIASICYAAENVFIAKANPGDCDALTIMCGLMWGGFFLITPAMIASGAWFDISTLGAPELATLGISLLHIIAYFGYIWLIGKAGPVFAAQVAYVVTGSGVVFGMMIYDEQHSPWIWAALCLMFVGLTLVKPRE